MNDMKVSMSQKLKWRKEYDFYTVYNFDTDDLFKISKAGIDILELADGNLTVEQVAGKIIEGNNLNISAMSKIVEFIELLEKKKLIKIS